MTRSIAEEVPIATQIFLWSLIDDQVNKGTQLDYLQKFELSATETGQAIVYSQEEPKWSQGKLLKIPNQFCITKTIWIIDNEDYQTMLFPEDY